MLTRKQNLLETMHGGNPDRFVNQYEAFGIVLGSPAGGGMIMPGTSGKNPWGVTFQWPEGFPGMMPVHDDEHLVIKDITRWRDYVTVPPLIFPDEAWAPFIAQAQAIDRNEQYVMPMVAPGIFEMCHHLTEISNCMTYLLTEPEAMHELIDCLTEWELGLAEQLVKYIKPDGIFHHDDWGTQRSTFMSPDMFDEFFLPAYKKIYGYYKANGVEMIVHHCDCYAATLVPEMIEMGIDVWQGPISTNNIPKLIEKYGEKITFMGGIDSGRVDRPGWTPELIAAETRAAVESCGKHYFIPNTSQGLPMSTFPGVYECVTAEIDKLSKEMF